MLVMMVKVVKLVIKIKKVDSSQVLARGEGRGPAGFEERGEPGEDPGD